MLSFLLIRESVKKYIFSFFPPKTCVCGIMLKNSYFYFLLGYKLLLSEKMCDRVLERCENEKGNVDVGYLLWKAIFNFFKLLLKKTLHQTVIGERTCFTISMPTSQNVYLLSI